MSKQPSDPTKLQPIVPTPGHHCSSTHTAAGIQAEEGGFYERTQPQPCSRSKSPPRTVGSDYQLLGMDYDQDQIFRETGEIAEVQRSRNQGIRVYCTKNEGHEGTTRHWRLGFTPKINNNCLTCWRFWLIKPHTLSRV